MQRMTVRPIQAAADWLDSAFVAVSGFLAIAHGVSSAELDQFQADRLPVRHRAGPSMSLST
ncbi:hypothetical protein ACWD5B_22970 [Streptomyces tanashiensis]|uniref:hypothetical protein n=1 Tax=Streptomyces tanashiensis TaxID=67367 RepID=UPI00368B1822